METPFVIKKVRAVNLNSDQIKDIATGAVRVSEKNGEVELYRFSLDQEELYRYRSQDFYKKTFATAGVRLQFRTNSKRLFLNVDVSPGSSRKYFSADVIVDGKLIGCLDNFSDFVMPAAYSKVELPMGVFSKEFNLGDGVKTVCIHMPWSTKTVIKELALDDNSFVEAVKPKKKLLAFGDSITQGYDALRPSNRYVAKLADFLEAEEINKAIGGEVFCPELAKSNESFSPDYITVAYGTNDWNNLDENTFIEKCRFFYFELSKNYPESKIFAITPIWRKDMDEDRKFGPFKNVEIDIINAVKDLKNVSVISGFDFIAQQVKYFADLNLHPNDDGFDFYFKSLSDRIKELI